MSEPGVSQRRRVTRGLTFEDMAARRAERLVNLVIALLATRQFLTAEKIRDAVPGYEAADGSRATEDAFKRMFERDKAELRDLGIPLETGRSSTFDTEDGYRIRRGDYELPPVEFDAAEAAAVGLAARLWQSATLGEPARQALMKLRAAGTDVSEADTGNSVPQLDASDPALPVLLDASRTATVVGFDYQKPNDPEPVRRTIEPWGVLSWRRRWYVAGLDRDRGEPRSFRLSRVTGPVRTVGPAGAFARPAGVDLLALVARRSPEDTRTARVRVTGAGAGQLRRMASSRHPADDDSHGELLVLEYTDVHSLARMVAAVGAGAVVLDPPDLRDAVIGRLRAVARPSAVVG